MRHIQRAEDMRGDIQEDVCCAIISNEVITY